MIEPHEGQRRPETTASGISRLWDGVHVERYDDNVEPVTRLLEALRNTHVNGGAAFGMFGIAANSDLDWFISRNRWNEIEFPEHFLRLPAVVAALPEICGNPFDGSHEFKWGSAFTLAGDLAQTLFQGGAYKKHEGGAGDAVAVAEDFRRWLFGDRFGEILVLNSFQPWSEWFWSVAWDATWLIIDKGRRRVSLLAITDTD
jgi:hypothetical protein